MTRIIQTGVAVNRQGAKLTTLIPVRIKRHGGRKVVIPAAVADKRPEHDAPILTALAKAFHWQRLIDEGIVSSGSGIARREGLHQTTVNELLRLTLLSPTLVRSISCSTVSMRKTGLQGFWSGQLTPNNRPETRIKSRV